MLIVFSKEMDHCDNFASCNNALSEGGRFLLGISGPPCQKWRRPLKGIDGIQ